MTNAPEELQLVTFNEEQQRLMVAAQEARARRAGTILHHGKGLRQTMAAILADAEMTEHENPHEAFLQLLRVPSEKHSVTALEDSILTLTVLRDSGVTS